ncbi:MAG: hypothetical protein JW883_06190, partial [Deltaproteobacteria bacterium]|nr:hypothetical protein [Deltaproteobacteria bacterium]
PPWRDMGIITGAISAVVRLRRTMAKSAYEAGPPWRDRSWIMPQREKPGLGQGSNLLNSSEIASSSRLWRDSLQ